MISLPWKHRTLEQMLADVAECGIGLREGASVDWLFRDGSIANRLISRKRLEQGGYQAVLVALGDELVSADNKMLNPPSNDVWHFDVEFIYDHASYKTIAEGLCRLAKGDLTFERIADYVDVAAECAWIEITHKGRTERINLRVNNDWTDELIFSLMQTKLIGARSERRFAVEPLGQDVLLVCMTPGDLKRLNRVTGLHFKEVD